MTEPAVGSGLPHPTAAAGDAHKAPAAAFQRWLRHVGPAEAVVALAELSAAQAGPGAAIFAVDHERRVVFWNEGAEHLFQLPATEMLGEHCLKANRCTTCIRECGVQTQASIRGATLTLHRADGEPIWVRKDAQGLFAPDGSFLGGFEILRPLGLPHASEKAPSGVTVSTTPSARTQDFHGIVSQDAAMHTVFQIIRNVGATEANVLLRGASGTGKELAARAIHLESPRHKNPFLAINCATLSPTLLESELFGHVKGAFTGAIRDRAGLFREAEGGTLFLDEVAEVPLELQARLLRVLQDRTVVPVGSSKAVHVNVRIVAATHTSLRERVASGRFREDLMYRLRVVPIFLPPLRERIGDVALLFHRFIHEQNQQGIRRIASIDPAVLRAIEGHDWPGNVRELHNVVEYAFAVGRGPTFTLTDLPPELRGAEPPGAGHVSLHAADEGDRIRDALNAAHGHVGKAAAALGMSRPTFWRHRKKLQI